MTFERSVVPWNGRSVPDYRSLRGSCAASGPAVLSALGLTLPLTVAAPVAADPEPGSPEYVARDSANIADAYGRITGQGGQLQNPAYLPALVADATATGVEQLLQQVATPTQPAITPGNVFPGWNVGNPLRDGWAGTRGRMRAVSFTNRYGALLRGHVYAPRRDAHDPYTGGALEGPYPGVVITTGSVQGSEGMYEWLAQDLAERGYVVLTYDVQGQGTSETFPHEGDSVDALPFCNPFAEPRDGEAFGCPGVPSQQKSNFVVGTRDALSFFTSTPRDPYDNQAADDLDTDTVNPFWRDFDRSPTGVRRRRAAPTGSRSSATRSGPLRSPRCRRSTVGSPRWSRWTSCTDRAPSPASRPTTSWSSRPWRCRRSTASRSRRGSCPEAAR